MTSRKNPESCNSSCGFSFPELKLVEKWEEILLHKNSRTITGCTCQVQNIRIKGKYTYHTEIHNLEIIWSHCKTNALKKSLQYNVNRHTYLHTLRVSWAALEVGDAPRTRGGGPLFGETWWGAGVGSPSLSRSAGGTACFARLRSAAANDLPPLLEEGCVGGTPTPTPGPGPGTVCPPGSEGAPERWCLFWEESDGNRWPPGGGLVPGGTPETQNSRPITDTEI